MCSKCILKKGNASEAAKSLGNVSSTKNEGSSEDKRLLMSKFYFFRAVMLCSVMPVRKSAFSKKLLTLYGSWIPHLANLQ